MKDILSFRTALVLALTGLVGLAGCRSGSKGDDDDDVTNADAGPDGGGDQGDTIYKVQMGTIPEGTVVNLEGVVVTAVDAYGGRIGGVYVQEPGGGEYSGVYVYNPQGADTVAPGDLVNVTGGAVQEFALDTDMTGRKLTEISPPDGGTITITKVGTGTLPTPPVVDPVALAADDAEAEKWEGVPVTFQNVAVVGTLRPIGSSDPTFVESRVSGPFRVDSGLTELNATNMPIDTCLDSITGIMDYFFNYKLVPRQASDIVAGTSCALENTVETCGDTMDNDHDGFADCADNTCKIVSDTCTATVTVEQIQDGTVAVDSSVDLENVVITAIAPFSFAGSPTAQLKIWVSDTAVAAPNQGVMLFKPDLAPGLTVDMLQVGDVVNVSSAIVTEFNELTELKSLNAGSPMVVSKVSAGPAPTPLAATPTSILDAGEQYEGVLLSVGTLKVTLTAAGTGNFQVAEPGDPTKTLLVRNTIVAAPAGLAVDQCYTLTGVLDYGNATGQPDPPGAAFRLVPREGDIVGPVACP